jgi:hypothetical protein
MKLATVNTAAGNFSSRGVFSPVNAKEYHESHQSQNIYWMWYYVNTQTKRTLKPDLNSCHYTTKANSNTDFILVCKEVPQAGKIIL